MSSRRRRGVGLLLTLALGCAPSARPPVEVVAVIRDGAPALAVFHQPDVRINAQVTPMLELSTFPILRLDRGTRTGDSAYFAEPPWAPRGSLRGSGQLRLSFCRTHEAFCTVDSFPVQLE